VRASGYTVRLSNRAKKTFSDIKMNYTLFYETQGYLESKRVPKEESGTLICEKITSQQTITLKTKAVDIVSGTLEAITRQESRPDGDGTYSTTTIIVAPGGSRKDLLVGCKLDIVVDGVVVKSVTEGTIKIEDPDDAK